MVEWVSRSGALLLLLVAAAGCSSQTRYPTLAPRQGEGDKRSFNVHDPLPETGVGPDTQSRPRGFVDERSEPRRTRESQGQVGVPPRAPFSATPGNPTGSPSSQAYPEVVPQ